MVAEPPRDDGWCRTERRGGSRGPAATARASPTRASATGASSTRLPPDGRPNRPMEPPGGLMEPRVFRPGGTLTRVSRRPPPRPSDRPAVGRSSRPSPPRVGVPLAGMARGAEAHLRVRAHRADDDRPRVRWRMAWWAALSERGGRRGSCRSPSRITAIRSSNRRTTCRRCSRSWPARWRKGAGVRSSCVPVPEPMEGDPQGLPKARSYLSAHSRPRPARRADLRRLPPLQHPAGHPARRARGSELRVRDV